MRRATTLRRIEGLEKSYSTEKSSVVRDSGRRTLLTREEFQFIGAIKKKCRNSTAQTPKSSSGSARIGEGRIRFQRERNRRLRSLGWLQPKMPPA